MAMDFLVDSGPSAGTPTSINGGGPEADGWGGRGRSPVGVSGGGVGLGSKAGVDSVWRAGDLSDPFDPRKRKKAGVDGVGGGGWHAHMETSEQSGGVMLGSEATGGGMKAGAGKKRGKVPGEAGCGLSGGVCACVVDVYAWAGPGGR